MTFACTTLKWELTCGSCSEMLQECVNHDTIAGSQKWVLWTFNWSILEYISYISLLLYSVPGSVTFFFLLRWEIYLILAPHVISYFWQAVELYWWNSALTVYLVKPVSRMKEPELCHVWEFSVLWGVPWTGLVLSCNFGSGNCNRTHTECLALLPWALFAVDSAAVLEP